MSNSDITVQKGQQGGWLCYATVKGYLMQRLYIGYTKAESVRKFKLEAEKS